MDQRFDLTARAGLEKKARMSAGFFNSGTAGLTDTAFIQDASRSMRGHRLPDKASQ